MAHYRKSERQSQISFVNPSHFFSQQKIMADVSVDKKLKLANTKKRFKELQELKKKRSEGHNVQNSTASESPNVNSAESSSRNTPVENVSVKSAHDVCFNENVVNTNSKTGSKHTFFEHEAGNPVQEHFSSTKDTSSDILNKEIQGIMGTQNDASKHTFFEHEAGNPVQAHFSSTKDTTSDMLNKEIQGIMGTQNDDTIQVNTASDLTPLNVINSNEIISTDLTNTSSLPNYFGATKNETPAEFFDNISSANSPELSQETENPSLLTYFNTSKDVECTNSENIGLPRYFDNINSSSTIWENTVPENRESFVEDYMLFPKREESNYKNLNQHSPTSNEDVLGQDDPEIKQNEIREYALKNVESENLEISNVEISQGSEKNLENIFTPDDTEKLMNYLGTTGATEEEKNIIYENTVEIDCTRDLTQKEILYSNTESLKQLSDQLAQIIQPNYELCPTGSITELEKRNLELAATLEQEKLQSEQLQAVNLQLQNRITQLEAELAQQLVGSNLQNAQEIAHLKNELQAHLQTIGLLVAEKTELSSNLSHYELNSKQKIAECEELQARLKASRGRVADLERELNNLKSEKSKTESVGEQYSAIVDNLRQEYKLLKEQKDELAQDLLEVREKLKNIQEENLKLQEENKDLSSKISLADIKIQQLTAGGTIGTDKQVEQLMQEKFSLESEIANLNQILKSIIKERDESTVQFQQYAQQLNGQISNLSSKLEQIQLEKENLIIQEQNRIKHIGELERQLQNIQSDQVSYVTRNTSNAELKNELEKLREMCVQLQVEKTTAEENFTRISNEKELLFKELEAKTDSISQLETMVEQLKGNQPDSVKLLATMESDKVAASMAIQQNKELKRQLESMQEVFRKMDDDKVVLTENLKGQQQTNKDLLEKLQKTELTLQSLADAIEIKDKELTHLRDASEEMDRQALHHEQLEDRLRHYEAHDNSAHILQHELQEAKQTVVKLTNELNSRKKEESQETYAEKKDVENELQEARRKIIELTNEINRLKMGSGEDNQNETVESQDKLDSINIEQAREVIEENKKQDDIDKNKNVIDKENAMKYLEEKVKRTMQEIADLTDEKQRLEHIVLQLQTETETIGEYVALYQHQRMVLKQKAVEKDQQLKQLANDREQIKVKLDRLNQLIKKLVTEKGSVPAELIQHHESMNNQYTNFCEEHSKMNDEILKISQNQSNVIEPEGDKNNKESSQTAEEIISLLSEIKTSNLVEPDANFHHCPWCSGQLITV